MKRVLHVLCIGLIFGFALSRVIIVAAHEQRTIGNGKYDVVVGWLNEPAGVGQANAATIEIKKAGTEDAVMGVEKTLQVKIAAGGKDEGTFTLHTVANKPGLYAADYTPPVTGSYIFTFTGNIEGNTIDERFESGPGRFDDVITADEAAQETPLPGTAIASASLATEAFVAAPTSSAVAPAAVPAAPNSDATVAIVIVGVIVVLVAGGLIVIRRKP
jgi:hypothetical protein